MFQLCTYCDTVFAPTIQIFENSNVWKEIELSPTSDQLQKTMLHNLL